MIVRGRVQGVGFRAHTRWVARELGIAGEVWNRRDGSVELVAQHADPAILSELAARLRFGPGRVDAVDVMDNPEIAASSFEVGHTR